MADQDLKIHIVSDADTKGFNDLAKATGEMNTGLGAVSVSAQATGKSLDKTAEKSEMSGRSFRRLAHAMGSEIPGAAALMEAGFEGATDPMLGATFLLLAGIEMLKSAINKINEEKKTAIRISEALADADADHSKVIEKQREALENAEFAEAEFHHNFVRNAQDAIDQSEKLADSILKAAAAAGEARPGNVMTSPARKLRTWKSAGSSATRRR